MRLLMIFPISKLAGRIAGRIPAGASGKGGLEIQMKDLDELILGGAESAAELGIVFFEDLDSLESNGKLQTDN